MKAAIPLLVLALTFIAVRGATTLGVISGFLCSCHGKAHVTLEVFCQTDHCQHKPHSHEEHEPIPEEVVTIPSESLATPTWIPLERSYLVPLFELVREAPTKEWGAPPPCLISFESHRIQQKRVLVLII